MAARAPISAARIDVMQQLQLAQATPRCTLDQLHHSRLCLPQAQYRTHQQQEQQGQQQGEKN
jgi:hypothetical protein